MQKLSEMKTGCSLSFMREISPEVFAALKKMGVDCSEYSFGYDYYMNRADFTKRAGEYAAMAEDSGIAQWSLHLPFSRELDISSQNKVMRAVTLYTDRELIKAAAAAGVKVMVLHPSSEPIDEESRPARMELSRQAIEMLAGVCADSGCRLAVENLPRTCLCRTSDEMITLLSGTGAGIVFDTNHCLIEDNIDFLKAVSAAGLEILSMHISDYYRDADGVLDERHDLPGTGINRWGELLSTVLGTGYRGPLMYEVARKPRLRGTEVSNEELAENMRKLKLGLIG